jgi:hypothetical protein
MTELPLFRPMKVLCAVELLTMNGSGGFRGLLPPSFRTE